VDEEILQDFLIEADELLEDLNGQLLALEDHPEDGELLNSVFRAFHTIKGGAGFLNLKPLVDTCHRAENIFDQIRNHQTAFTSQVMDRMSEVLDFLVGAFQSLKSGQGVTPVDSALLRGLDELLGQSASAPPPPVSSASLPKPVSLSEDISDDEFESVLDQMYVGTAPGLAQARPVTEVSEDITDHEFEALLDQMYVGTAPGLAAKSPPVSEDITDDEFEAVLDQLYVGTAPGLVEQAPKLSPTPAASVKPAVDESASKKEKPETSVRVDTRKLDDIMNLVGELVLVRNRLKRLKSHGKAGDSDTAVAQTVSILDHVTTDLQNAVMKTRMQPVHKVFGRFPRVVRDLARSLNKQIRLEMVGEETELDKNLVEALADPLVHLVRNSVDHGIEMPDIRLKRGKMAEGRIILSARQQGDHIQMVIEDDGGGIDPAVIRRKAIEKGLLDASSAESLPDKEILNFIMAAGFSTKETISEISGRGVGMDVVKTMINRLNGQIDIESELGRGSRITIQIPLTLAILPTLMITVGTQNFAIPLSNVVEIFEYDSKATNVIDHQLTVRLRGKSLPLYKLTDWLRTSPPAQVCPAPKVVIVEAGGKSTGLLVDHVNGQEEVVIKPLGALLQGQPGFAGATITGDGRIALILDVMGLISARI